MPGSRRWRLRPEPVDGDPPAARAQLFPAFDRQVELFAEGALREAAFDGGGGDVRFSPLVRHAVYEAVHEASRRDGVPAGVGHLLAAVFAAPGSAASTVAAHLWVPAHLDRQSRRYRAGDGLPPWAPEALKAAGVLPSDVSRAGTGTVEVLLSILELHEQLDRAGAALPPPVDRDNTAGRVLRDHGITYLDAIRRDLRV
ncbi:hypothetical protein [Virgisporangium ochraceum]|nr:hypothetical protein [Virgisporangium ochraceum]